MTKWKKILCNTHFVKWPFKGLIKSVIIFMACANKYAHLLEMVIYFPQVALIRFQPGKS